MSKEKGKETSERQGMLTETRKQSFKVELYLLLLISLATTVFENECEHIQWSK